ncbi:MAG: TAXI family TRAP transporter solute-binding subunit [Methylibium sp.]
MVLRLTCLILGLALVGGSAAAQAETRWLGLAAGAPGATETELASDMASLFTPGAPMRALPLLGDLGAGNIALLLNEPSVDIAFVSADALTAASAAHGAALAEKLELVARLYPQEVHVLARAEIKTVAQLAGKRVSVGPEGSGSAATAAALFKALGIDVEPLDLDAATSIARLKQGTIAAAVIVGGKPMPLLSAVPPTPGLHLLPIPFGGALEASHLPTRLGHADYPALIKDGTEVQTVATGLVLLAAKAKRDGGSAKRVAQFIDTVFPRFAELKARDRHPKWREINLAASWPGLTKAHAAEAWLARQQTMSAATIAAPSPEKAQGLGNNEKEALFKQFIEWQRAKGH